MVVEHLALWTRDLERLRDFYTRWFEATANVVYESRRRAGFRSYFLTFPGGGTRLEIMVVPGLDDAVPGERVGMAHFAMAVGTRSAVDVLCARMRDAGVRVRSAPRETGDGYYEAVLEDPDGNLMEIMATPESGETDGSALAAT